MARPNLNLASILLRASRAGTPAMIRGQDAVDRGVMSPDGRANMPGHLGGRYVPGAGQFGVGVNLPSNSSPPDPIGNLDDDIPPADPHDPYAPHGAGGGPRVDVGTAPQGFITSPFGGIFPMVPGEKLLGGGFLGIDPNTGKGVYNPLGSGAAADLDKYHADNSFVGGISANNTVGSNHGPSGHNANWWVF